MITELSIRNLAVIEHVHVSFGKGFHVLTGETGAGKSMVIDALSLLVGGRGSADLIRHGESKAEIEAMFELESSHPVWATLTDLGIDADPSEPLIIRREISSQGKSVCRINGQMVNLTMLREVGDWLVNIHGQHEHQSLLKTERHLEWLDVYDDAAISPLKQAYLDLYEQYTAANRELSELEQTSRQTLQMQDLYKFQLEEIDSARLKVDEDEWLEEEKRKLANAEKLMQAITDSYDALYANGRALDSLGRAMKRIEDIVQFDTGTLKPLLEQIQSAYYQLEDAAYQTRDYRDSIEFNPDRLEEIEDRLALIAGLKRKYGSTIEEIIAYADQIRAQIELMENKDERITELKRTLEIVKPKLMQAAEQLSEARRMAGDRLAQEIEQQLKDLHMAHTRFYVELRRTEGANGEDSFTRNGYDHAEFLISPNPGEPLRPLAKIASGGELSRIMLALKTIFARIDKVPVLVFDEVDTGVSGRAAQAIAEKLAELAGSCQVFAVTHLPQVASMGDEHYAIMKVLEGGRTFTIVERLAREGRIEETARLMGGAEITEATRQHADEMLNLADQIRSAKR
jgi:DNA repair protein RecN (Recombination protein N)